MDRVKMVVLLLGCVALGGCQIAAPPVSAGKLLRHNASVDATGLDQLQVIASLKVRCAAPLKWAISPLQKTSLYTHRQWRSPSAQTGVGVAYVKMPLPLSAQMLVFFAKSEYAKKRDDGRVIGQWTDSLGRTWFEAENNRYHIRGYAVTRGFDAWIVYTGYRTTAPPSPDELSVAMRCAETILPLPLVQTVMP